jgi:hypothetical protein
MAGPPRGPAKPLSRACPHSPFCLNFCNWFAPNKNSQHLNSIRLSSSVPARPVTRPVTRTSYPLRRTPQGQSRISENSDPDNSTSSEAVQLAVVRSVASTWIVVTQLDAELGHLRGPAVGRLLRRPRRTRSHSGRRSCPSCLCERKVFHPPRKTRPEFCQVPGAALCASRPFRVPAVFLRNGGNALRANRGVSAPPRPSVRSRTSENSDPDSSTSSEAAQLAVIRSVASTWIVVTQLAAELGRPRQYAQKPQIGGLPLPPNTTGSYIE